MNASNRFYVLALFLALGHSSHTSNGTSVRTFNYVLDNDLHLSMKVNDLTSTWSVELTLEQPQGWIGFGTTVSGMIGGQVVIGLPGDSTSPALYSLTAKSMSGVIREPDSVQVFLHQRSITQNTTHTVLKYTLPLDLTRFRPIVSNGENQFLWAVGETNAFTLHRSRNQFIANLVQSEDGNTTKRTSLIYSKSVTHGVFMSVAWAILVPLAVVSSLLRDLLPGIWFTLHRALNILAVICTIIGLFVSVHNVTFGDGNHFRKFSHRVVGLVVTIGVIGQVVGGLARPHATAVHQMEGQSTTQNPVDNEHENSGTNQNRGNRTNINNMSATRTLWEIGHRWIGLSLIGLAWYDCYTGITVFMGLYPDVMDLRPVYWGVIGAYGGMAVTICVVAMVASVAK